MRVTSPSTLLLGVVLFCIATALAAVSLATSPAWLGVGLEGDAPDAPLTVVTLDPNGPAGKGRDQARRAPDRRGRDGADWIDGWKARTAQSRRPAPRRAWSSMIWRPRR
jgi:hypothetical protein